VPRFLHGYTINRFIAGEFNKYYGVSYETIRNVPYKIENGSLPFNPKQNEKFILYQGAVNEGRSFETLIPAFKSIDANLVVCGNGNFMQQALQIVKENNLENKIRFIGWVSPDILKSYTRKAYIGVNIIENKGLSNRLSLSNRFFDYIQSALPQVSIDYPAYREINNEYECALLIEDTSTDTIEKAINRLLNDQQLYYRIRDKAVIAAGIYNWNNEEKKLLNFYQNIFESA